MGATHMAAIIERTIEHAVQTYSLGDSVWYDSTLTVLPGPDGQPNPVYAVVMSISSAQIGQRLTTMLFVPLEDVAKASEIEAALREALEGLRQARTKMLQEHKAQGGAVLVGSGA